MAKRIVSISHKFRLAGAISFRKDYSPPSSPSSRPYSWPASSTPSAPAATGRASSHACGPTPSPARALRLLLLGISTTAPSSMMAAVPWAARPPPPCPLSSTRPRRSGRDQGGAGRRPGLGRRAGAETAGAGAGAAQGEPESGRGEREERWERGEGMTCGTHCLVGKKKPLPRHLKTTKTSLEGEN